MLSSPKCVKRFFATVRSFWSWAFKLSSSSKARLAWSTPTVTLRENRISFKIVKVHVFFGEICIFCVLWKLDHWWWRHRFAKSAMWLDQIFVLRIIQLFQCMHIFVSFCAFAYIRVFLHVQPPNPVIHWIWSLNLLMIYLPLLINTVIFTFHQSQIPNSPSSSPSKENLLKAFLDNGNVVGVELFPVGLVDQTHQ